jgi:hypothetical protein
MALSAAQKKARARFTKAAKKAKQLRKANPRLSQAEAIKKAFALDKKPAAKKKAAPKKRAAKKVVRKKAARKVSGVSTRSKSHTDKNKFTVNMQLGAIRGGSKFILYKGMQIEKKPITIGKKRGFVYISGGMTWSTLKDAKRYILHLSK